MSFNDVKARMIVKGMANISIISQPFVITTKGSECTTIVQKNTNNPTIVEAKAIPTKYKQSITQANVRK